MWKVNERRATDAKWWQKLTLKNIIKFGLKINAPYKNTEDTNYDTFGPHVHTVFSERGRSNEHPGEFGYNWSNGFGEDY